MIYAIQVGENGPVKLGRAGDPQKRLGNLQVAHHESLRLLASCYSVLDDDKQEAKYHARHAQDRLRGEWFKPTAAVLNTVEEIKRGPQTMEAYAGAIAGEYKNLILMSAIRLMERLIKRREANGKA